MFIDNSFHVKRANIGKIISFWRGTPLWRSRAQASLNYKGSGLKTILKSTFDAKNFIRSCLGLSFATSLQFTLKMCAAARICKKYRQNPVFGGSRLFKVIDVNKTKRPVTNNR